MRVHLINPPSDCVNDDRLEPPLGLLYIASEVREQTCNEVSVLDMTGCSSESEMTTRMNAIPPGDLYGISCVSTTYHIVKSLVRRIREVSPNATVVLGGAHPTALPEATISDIAPDAVVIGEGEDAFTRIASAVAMNRSPRGIIQGIARGDVDTYHTPARDLVDLTTYNRRLSGKPVVSLVSSRGCVHRCLHCNSVVMGGGSRSVRYRSADSVLSEMASLCDRYDQFRFNDDHFTGNPRLGEMLERIRDLKIQFRAFARIEDLDDVTCGQLREAGCLLVMVGLESLNESNLRAIGKGRQYPHMRNVAVARRHGLVVRASFIVGLPHDSDESVQRSFEVASRLGVDEYVVYPLIPYPGTPLWDHPERFGYEIVERDFTQYIQRGRQGRTCFALRHRDFGPDDVERWLFTASRLMEAGGAIHKMHSQMAQ